MLPLVAALGLVAYALLETTGALGAFLFIGVLFFGGALAAWMSAADVAA